MTARHLFNVVLVAGLFAMHADARAEATPKSWPADLRAAKALLENDVPLAYRRALVLKSTLGSDSQPKDRIALLNLLARAEVYLGLTGQASATAAEAFALAAQHADRAGQAEADLSASINAINQADIEGLKKFTTRSLELLDGVPRPDLLSEAMLRNAMLYRRTNRFAESVSMAVNALDLAKRSDDPLALTYAHQGMAVSYEQSGHLDKARAQYEEMGVQARRANSKLLEAFSRLGQGGTIAATSDRSRGEALIREANGLFRQTGAPFAINFGQSSLANVLRLQGRFDEALAVMNDVIRRFEANPNRIGMWFSLHTRSRLHEQLRDVASAQADSERAYALATEIGFTPYMRDSAHHLSALVARMGNYCRAYELAQEGLALGERTTREATSDRMVELAERYAEEGRQRQVDALNQQNLQQQAALERASLRQQSLWSLLGLSMLTLVGGGLLMLRLRRSERNLQRQTSILRSVLDSMAEGVVVSDARGGVILSNPVAIDLLTTHPVGPDDNTTPEAAAEPKLRESAVAHIVDELPLLQATRGDQRDPIELHLPLRDGRPERWISLSMRPLPASGQLGGGGVLVFSDITQRRRTQELARAREQEFRALVENSPDCVTRFDADCRRRYVNPATQRLFKYSAEVLLGRRPTDEPVTLGAQAQAYEARLRQVLAEGQDMDFDAVFTDAGGAVQAFQIRLVPELDESGTIVSVLSISRDVSRIMATQRQLKTLLENLPDPVARLDHEGRHLVVNPAMTKVFGLHEAAFEGRTLGDIGRDPSGLMREAIARCVAASSETAFEWPWSDGASERFFECRLVPEYDAADRLYSLLAILREVTDRRRYESQVRELEYRREAAREDERRLIARELHDELGQILSALRLEVSAIRLGPGRDDPALTLRTISMLGLVDSVIAVQRDLVHNLRPEALEMGIAAGLEWLVSEFAARHQVTCSLDTDIADESALLDEVQTIMIFRITQESLTNVAKHAHCNNLEVSLVGQGGEMVLTVVDDGVGFAYDAARKPKSFGLIGLKERALMLRGQLTITSAPGAGTRVCVRFPVAGGPRNDPSLGDVDALETLRKS